MLISRRAPYINNGKRAPHGCRPNMSSLYYPLLGDIRQSAHAEGMRKRFLIMRKYRDQYTDLCTTVHNGRTQHLHDHGYLVEYHGAGYDGGSRVDLLVENWMPVSWLENGAMEEPWQLTPVPGLDTGTTYMSTVIRAGLRA